VSLRVENVSVRFGGVVALESVTFEARPGEVLGVIGPNGAGKTTLFNVISGLQRPSTGTVTLDDRKLTHLQMHRIAALGVTRTFQTPVMFWGLSVCESLMVALEASARGSKASEGAAHALLAGTPLESCADVLAESLSFGQERVLEILRALAVEPKVLLLDEPLSGLSGDEIDAVLELVRAARSRGISILFVEHDLHRLLAAADRFVVLDRRKIAEGSPEAICNDPVVLDAYIGDELSA
jgi:ABC-type branched-subunit amino acid transport system ATPase component